MKFESGLPNEVDLCRAVQHVCQHNFSDFYPPHQIVGNLLYYRYINPAIVSPDAFDIINVSADKALTMDQRRNLGSVAKVLQFAAANKGVRLVFVYEFLS